MHETATELAAAHSSRDPPRTTAHLHARIRHRDAASYAVRRVVAHCSHGPHLGHKVVHIVHLHRLLNGESLRVSRRHGSLTQRGAWHLGDLVEGGPPAREVACSSDLDQLARPRPTNPQRGRPYGRPNWSTPRAAMGWCERHPLVSLRPDPNSNPDANPTLLESSRVSPPQAVRRWATYPADTSISNLAASLALVRGGGPTLALTRGLL